MKEYSVNTDKNKRDIALENKIFTRAQNINLFLQPETKAKLDLIAKDLFHYMATESQIDDIEFFVKQKIGRSFKQISNEQYNILSFYVLTEVARFFTVEEELYKNLDRLKEKSGTDFLMLQTTMPDRRYRIKQILSQILEKIYSAQDNIIKNIK